MSRHGDNIHSMAKARKVEKDLMKVFNQVTNWLNSPRTKNWQLPRLNSISSKLIDIRDELYEAFPELQDGNETR